jgi:bifunctional N-acetylglucosamine-1-phosphate-uridyltransferase/glucosamine-1-phosphate-acetyltransferase GlmU-like protein
MNNIGAIILAAGKGSRMKAKQTNKVTYMLGDKPMIMHVVHLLEGMNLSPVVIVIGFAKESVKSLFNNDVLFAEQSKRLGTAHAALQALKVLPEDVTDVFILNGDDSAFYTKEVLNKLKEEHIKNNNAITFLTLDVANPFGLGRVVRKEGKVVATVEEKDATDEERKINEINPACYLFNVNFLRKNIRNVPKSPVTGEYYLMSLVEIAIAKGDKVEGIKGGNIPWRGVNTGEELKEAEELYAKTTGTRIAS